MPPRPSLGSNPGTTSPPGRSPELQTAGRCALQARHGAPEPPEPQESMARKPRQETAAAKVADHAPPPQSSLGRGRDPKGTWGGCAEKPPRARAQGEGGGLRLPSSAVSVCPCVSASSDSAGGCPGQCAPSPCPTRVRQTARSTWNPRSLKSTARAGRLPVFLGWPSIRTARLHPGRLYAGTRTRRGVGSGRVPPGRRKAGCLQVFPARLSGLL